MPELTPENRVQVAAQIGAWIIPPDGAEFVGEAQLALAESLPIYALRRNMDGFSSMGAVFAPLGASLHLLRGPLGDAIGHARSQISPIGLSELRSLARTSALAGLIDQAMEQLTPWATPEREARALLCAPLNLTALWLTGSDLDLVRVVRANEGDAFDLNEPVDSEKFLRRVQEAIVRRREEAAKVRRD